MVSLDFGLVDVDKGPVLDGTLPTSVNKTVIDLLYFLIFCSNRIGVEVPKTSPYDLGHVGV